MLKIILQPMAEYRAYILDDSGDILLSEELVASSDAAAITAGLQIAALYRSRWTISGRGGISDLVIPADNDFIRN